MSIIHDRIIEILKSLPRYNLTITGSEFYGQELEPWQDENGEYILWEDIEKKINELTTS